MVYRVYHTELGEPKRESICVSTRPSKAFVSEETAMAWAFKARANGATIWWIQGPGGFVVTREDFERKYWQR